MKKLTKGSALSTVILAIFILIVIGSAVMNLVVYNYQLRHLDLKIRRAEYKNEMIMDKIYEITQSTIITAVGLAKVQAVDAVDIAVQEELELYENYVIEKEKLTNEWLNSLGEDVTFADNAEYQLALNTYVEDNLDEKYKNLSFHFLSAGKQNQYKIQQEYDKVFKEIYKYAIDRDQNVEVVDLIRKNIKLEEIRNVNSLIDNIITGEKYTDIVNNISSNLYFNSENNFYDRITQDLTDDCASIETELVYDNTKNVFVLSNNVLYKTKGTPTTTLYADFILTIPSFDSVSTIDQKAIEFSNPLVGNKALIAGGLLNIEDGSTVNINGDALAVKGIVGDYMTLTSNGKLITAGDIKLNASELNTNTVYYRNLFLNGSEKSKVKFSGDVYASDDLEINTGNFEINQTSGSYYGFNDISDLTQGADTSSSIIINATTINSTSSITLNNLYLAGRAFIDKVVKLSNTNEYYKTGESISVKGNYIAYQTPILDTSSSYFVEKVNYDSYIIDSALPLKLVNSFANQTSPIQLLDFDANHKSKYFVDFGKEAIDLLKIPKITINSLKYMQGAGVGRITSAGEYSVIAPRVTGLMDDTAFRTNCANEYELQTKYFGYYSYKTEIFGENGWLNTLTSTSNIDNQPILVQNGNITLTEEDLAVYRVIICTGNININVENTANFSGLMIAGGDININGDVNFSVDKKGITDLILKGAKEDSTATERKLFLLFKYDNSGTRYIITAAGASNINISDLLGIINWTKKDWGYL